MAKLPLVQSNMCPMRNNLIYADGQMVHLITCQVHFESACSFPNNFQGQLTIWFFEKNLLARQVTVPV